MAGLADLHDVMPSATPSDAEIAAWEALTREEQLRRLRQLLTSQEATTPVNTTMAEIWAEVEAEFSQGG